MTAAHQFWTWNAHFQANNNIHIYIRGWKRDKEEKSRNDWWQETSDSHASFFIGRSIVTDLSARRAAPSRVSRAVSQVETIETRQAVVYRELIVRRFSFISRVMRFLRPRSSPGPSLCTCGWRTRDQKVVCNRFNGSRCCSTRVWPPMD